MNYTSSHSKRFMQKITLFLLILGFSRALVSSDQTVAKQPWPGLWKTLTSNLTQNEIASVAALKAQTLKTLNSLVPNFAQQVRITKKSLETSLEYINKIIGTLGIAEKMTPTEVQDHSLYLENQIKKLEEQKRIQQGAGSV